MFGWVTPKKKDRIKQVANFYNKWTPELLKITDTFQAARDENIEDTYDYIIEKAQLKNGQNILDAGCGVGGPLRYMASKLDANFSAVTISEVQYDYILEHLTDEIAPKVNLQLGDYHNLADNLTAPVYDRILFLESFGHSDNKLHLIREIKKALKKDGLLYIKDIFAMPITNDKNGKRVKKALKQSDEIFVYKHVTPEELVSLLVQEGFEILDVGPVQISPYDITAEFTKRGMFKLPTDVNFAQACEILAIQK